MNWIKERLQALLIIAASYMTAFMVWSLSDRIFGLVSPGFASVVAAPGGVSGSDLVANLLTLSALTISGCLAYLCLPSDRVEIRIATYVKVCLFRELIEEDDFDQFFDKLPAHEVTPSCRAIRGLLKPRSGIGGWHGMGEGDLAETFGSKEWRKLRRFVDTHGDAKEVIILIVGLALAMLGATGCLIARYLGIWTAHYNGFEAATITLLLLLNVLVTWATVSMAVGGRTGERSARERIDTFVKELSPRVKQHQARRRDDNLSEMSAQAQEVSAAASSQPPHIAVVAGTTTRKTTRTRTPR